jgi:cell division protein FtsL
MTLTYDNRSAAYDLNMFKDSTAKKLPKKKTEQQAEKAPKNKVVSLPQDEIVKIRRRKHNPFKLFLGGITGVAVTFAVAVIIIGQVQLTELNQQIITAEETLRNTQSSYTQVQMAVQSKLSTTEIENYAKEKLGMSKAENAQKEFVSLSEGDKAEISEDANQNFFQKIINAFKGLWS